MAPLRAPKQHVIGNWPIRLKSLESRRSIAVIAQFSRFFLTLFFGMAYREKKIVAAAQPEKPNNARTRDYFFRIHRPISRKLETSTPRVVFS